MAETKDKYNLVIWFWIDVAAWNELPHKFICTCVFSARAPKFPLFSNRIGLVRQGDFPWRLGRSLTENRRAEWVGDFYEGIWNMHIAIWVFPIINPIRRLRMIQLRTSLRSVPLVRSKSISWRMINDVAGTGRETKHRYCRRPLGAWKLSSRVHSSEDDCVSPALSNQLDVKRFICAADAEEQRVCHWTSNRSQNEPKPTPLGRTWSYVGPSNHFQAATDIQLTDPLHL